MRCWMGAGGTAIIIPILDALGRGWTFTLIGVIIFFLSFMPWMLLKWGPKWREERRLRIERQQEDKDEKERRRHSGRTLNEEGEEGEENKAVDEKIRESGADASRRISKVSPEQERSATEKQERS